MFVVHSIDVCLQVAKRLRGRNKQSEGHAILNAAWPLGQSCHSISFTQIFFQLQQLGLEHC
eukprot:4147511-Amphidinium_carterae.1